MINKVVDLTKKSFNNYSGPAEEFKLKNIIFGYNGRGKSSLAIGIKDAHISSGLDESKMRFFDKDYVNDNLSLQDPTTGARNKIKGVIAHFSAKDVKSEQKIKELEKKLVDIDKIQENINKLSSEVRTAIDAIHDRRRGTAAIQKKNKDLDIEEVVRLYSQDIDEAKKVEADENKLSKIEGDNVIGEKIELIKTVAIHGYDGITDGDIEATQRIFEKTFENISIPASEVVEWLNAGLEFHQEGDKCKFCGGDVNKHEIEKKVNEYNANEKQKATKTLQALDDKLAELQNVISADLEKKSNTISSLEEDVKIENNFLYIEEASIGIANARNVIKSKIKNIDKKITFEAFKGDLQKFNDAVTSLNSIKNSQLDKLETQNNNKDKLVKGAIGIEISSNTMINDKLSELKDAKKLLSQSKIDNATTNNKIQTLKQAENATSDFANYINEILKNLNINLKLSVSEDGKNYIIQHTQTNVSLTISDISEGERNLLALLFFYYELFNDNAQQDFKNSIELIVVDDPISSMDDINKMYILELMKQIVAIETPQVFIMTHSWDDFSSICYGLFDKPATPTVPATPYGFYEIKKDASGNSLLAKTKSNIPPYHHNFLEVYEFSQRPDITSLDDCDIYHMPNIMRQVLEGFLGFKTHKNSPTKNNEVEIGRILFDKEWNLINEADKTELGKLLLVINVNSHGSSRSPDEIWQSAKLLMKRIKKIDVKHFNTNKEPLA